MCPGQVTARSDESLHASTARDPRQKLGFSPLEVQDTAMDGGTINVATLVRATLGLSRGRNLTSTAGNSADPRWGSTLWGRGGNGSK